MEESRHNTRFFKFEKHLPDDQLGTPVRNYAIDFRDTANLDINNLMKSFGGKFDDLYYNLDHGVSLSTVIIIFLVGIVLVFLAFK